MRHFAFEPAEILKLGGGGGEWWGGGVGGGGGSPLIRASWPQQQKGRRRALSLQGKKKGEEEGDAAQVESERGSRGILLFEPAVGGKTRKKRGGLFDWRPRRGKKKRRGEALRTCVTRGEASFF